MTNIEIPEIVHLLTLRIDDLVHAIGLQGQYDANDFVAYNPTRNDTHLGSFRICVRGCKQGVWKEFAGGEQGDALELINYCLFGNLDKHNAIQWAKQFLGIVGISSGELKKIQQEAVKRKAETIAREKEQRQQRAKFAQRIFFGAETNIINSPIDNYLSNRGIDIRLLGRQPKSLRFAKECWYSKTESYPALVAAITSPADQFIAVHRTYIFPQDGSYVKKDKRVLGDFAGSVIRIWRGDTNASIKQLETGKVAETENSDTLILTEGIEDALSVAVACPEYRIWTTISVGNMRNVTIPDCIHNVIICADNDEKDSVAADAVIKAAEEIEKQRVTVRIARSEVGKDFNDQLTAE